MVVMIFSDIQEIHNEETLMGPSQISRAHSKMKAQEGFIFLQMLQP
jgi:hypothetical protein